MHMKLLLTLPFIAFHFIASAQSISTSTVNVGGNSAAIKDFQFDWSIGEGSSIASFYSTNNNLIVTTGVLQPIQKEKIVFTNNSINWIKEEMSMYPQPAKDYFEVSFKLEAIGNINLDLIDQFGHKIESRKLYYNKTNVSERFEISNFSPGVYYLNAIMTADGSKLTIRKGIFKIIKL